MVPEEQKFWLDKIQSSAMSTRELEDAIAASRDPASGLSVNQRALSEVRTALRQLNQITDEQEGLIADLVRAGIPRSRVAPLEAALVALASPLAEVREALVERTTSGRS